METLDNHAFACGHRALSIASLSLTSAVENGTYASERNRCINRFRRKAIHAGLDFQTGRRGDLIPWYELPAASQRNRMGGLQSAGYTLVLARDAYVWAYVTRP